MKQIRVFSSTEIRDAVFKAVDYAILCKTEGVGIGMRHEVWRPDYSVPFYVENITNETETLNIASYDISTTGSYLEVNIEYSIDRINWNTFGTTGEIPLTKTLEPGDKIYLRATTNAWVVDPKHYNSIYGVSKVGGNIMSLLYGSNFTGNERSFPNNSNRTFYNLFCNYYGSGNNKLIDASELILSATALTEGCYTSMFNGCVSLTQAPALPATTLTNYCYSGMFQGCTSLTQAPELPSNMLASYCYNSMFYGCTSLTQAPALPATTLTEGCYYSMFQGCTSLTQAPELPATTLATRCYCTMFQGCTSLTQAPELPIVTLALSCYYAMFYGCTSLTQAPELPATTLVDYCYFNMFADCTNLNYVKCFATDISATYCTVNWTYNVSPTGTFIKNASTEWTTGANGIPEGWTVEDAA